MEGAWWVILYLGNFLTRLRTLTLPFMEYWGAAECYGVREWQHQGRVLSDDLVWGNLQTRAMLKEAGAAADPAVRALGRGNEH